MAAHKEANFHGIILYRQNYREKDMLVKFFTAEFGTKMFIIRGARRSNFKMRADILPFTYGQYLGSISDTGLSYIKTPIDTHHYLNISEDIILNAYATYLMGLIDAALSENEPELKWFNKLYYALQLIDKKIDPAVVTNIFEIQLLPILGIAPEWNECVVCHNDTLPLDYSENYGGMLCKKHWHLDPRRFHLDKKTVYYLQLFAKVDLKRIHTIDINPTTKARLRQLLDVIYEDGVGLHLKSKEFLKQINRLS